MTRTRFNHMELTFERGTLDADMRADIDAFYGGVFGWSSREVELFGQSNHLLRVDEGQFILLAESSKPVSSPGFDHLGLLMDSRADVDEALERVQRFQEKDDRVKIQLYDDLDTTTSVVRAFYVKYLLPIFFDVQVLEYKDGFGPEHNWAWV
jgi:predicted enzyme related to lactoylglutathione lyase